MLDNVQLFEHQKPIFTNNIPVFKSLFRVGKVFFISFGFFVKVITLNIYSLRGALFDHRFFDLLWSPRVIKRHDWFYVECHSQVLYPVFNKGQVNIMR